MNIFDFAGLNYWAIAIVVIFQQLLGVVWYKVFNKPWLAGIGLKVKDLEAMKGTPRQWYPYVISTFTSLLAVLLLALLIQALALENFIEGFLFGSILAVAFILTTNALNYSFEGRGLKLFLINAGYPLISYGLAGLLLAYWS